MPKQTDITRVMVIGSGPIIIGQAAEFDYAGTQACQALKEEGYEVILVNSNPATIMTDEQIADRVYLEPITPEFVEKIIEKERPQGLLPTLGGQVGLNMAKDLHQAGVLDRYNIRLLGTSLETIEKAEDRAKFKELMIEIGENIPPSKIVETVDSALEFAEEAKYPLIIRPAYTLGGTGGGIANNPEEMKEIVGKGLKLSPIHQCLIEKSVAGWKEIEYEVMRDANGNTITVCNMENIDPVGIHTGDSIVVAPSQTISDKEYQMLRSSAIKIINALEIEGGCNVQYALNPKSREYIVIEVNPRVSRSSALASKATGYPIAKVAAKIAIGKTLDEIRNPVTKNTYAAFEPALDYCVVKIPRFPFDKFERAERVLGTQMKATGEVMSIDRTFTGALMKAIRSLEMGQDSLLHQKINNPDEEKLQSKIGIPNDERLFYIAEAFRQGKSIEWVHELSEIDPYFLHEINRIVELEKQINDSDLTPELLRKAKENGFSDRVIGSLTNQSMLDVRKLRKSWKINPVYKMVDTCAAEFAAATPYYYSCYDQENEVEIPYGKKAIVLGSGPIRIGQGIEFDYSAVHAAWKLKESGVQSVIINNNPETVSTDFNTSDRLYFEPLTLEDVLNIIEQEGGELNLDDFSNQKLDLEGVICQFGGQTAINLAVPLAEYGVPIMGTPIEEMDRAEDRKKFDELLTRLEIPRPAGSTATSVDEAVKIAEELNYPVLVRPSFVLGGRAMEIVYNTEEMISYMQSAIDVSEDRPILIDRYLIGKEVEVDCVCDGDQVIIAGIMEHVERAGVHSGDSVAVYPPVSISGKQRLQIVDYSTRLALALKVKGLVNIQFIIFGSEVYVIEVNPRSSRTVPFLTKVTGLPLAKMATQIILGYSLVVLGFAVLPGNVQKNFKGEYGLWGKGWLLPEPQNRTCIKAPVFSWQKLTTVDTDLSPEMKSTGEVMGTSNDFALALYKALLASGMNIVFEGAILITVADKDKPEAMNIANLFHQLGFTVYATEGTADALKACKIESVVLAKVSEGDDSIPELIRNGKIQYVINTLPHHHKHVDRDGFIIRRTAVEFGVPCMTSLDTARSLSETLLSIRGGFEPHISAVQDWEKLHKELL